MKRFGTLLSGIVAVSLMLCNILPVAAQPSSQGEPVPRVDPSFKEGVHWSTDGWMGPVLPIVAIGSARCPGR